MVHYASILMRQAATAHRSRAILLENIYVSDKTNPAKNAPRADHLPPARPLEAEFSSSFGFYKSSTQVFGLINQFVIQHPVFCKALASVEADFNPLSAYYSNPSVAKSNSQSDIAKIREALITKVGPQLGAVASKIAKSLPEIVTSARQLTGW